MLSILMSTTRDVLVATTALPTIVTPAPGKIVKEFPPVFTIFNDKVSPTIQSGQAATIAAADGVVAFTAAAVVDVSIFPNNMAVVMLPVALRARGEVVLDICPDAPLRRITDAVAVVLPIVVILPPTVEISTAPVPAVLPMTMFDAAPPSRVMGPSPCISRPPDPNDSWIPPAEFNADIRIASAMLSPDVMYTPPDDEPMLIASAAVLVFAWMTTVPETSASMLSVTVKVLVVVESLKTVSFNTDSVTNLAKRARSACTLWIPRFLRLPNGNINSVDDTGMLIRNTIVESDKKDGHSAGFTYRFWFHSYNKRKYRGTIRIQSNNVDTSLFYNIPKRTERQ